MNIVSVFKRFPDQRACIAHLERVRWGDKAACPHCGSLHVARKREGKRVGRWNCHDCKSSFNVLSGTVMQKTKIPLQKWFLAIALIVNAKKSLSSHQLARDLEMHQNSAWYLMQRIRAAMAANQGDFLRGIVEADETFLGGKPRKRNRRGSRKPAKRGRGTDKTAVIGAVERGGKVKAMVTDDLSGRGILRFIRDSVDPEGSILISDEYAAYQAVQPYMPHLAVNHQEHYSDRSGGHTNTIEGFWGLLKRAWYGQHHHYSKDFSPLYVAESSWKYNHRKDVDAFGSFMRVVFA
ncbi:MAG: IS1595 family transposase [bacterium]|nr:IS1595 family transposase [bacterium]